MVKIQQITRISCICHDGMNQEELLTFCTVGCGNNLHIECALRWMEHKVSQMQAVTCPLCRAEWTLEFLRYIEAQSKENRLKALHEQQQKAREETKKKEKETIKVATKEKVLKEIQDKIAASGFGIEGKGLTIKGITGANSDAINKCEESKVTRKGAIIAKKELYKRKPPRDFKIRKTTAKLRTETKAAKNSSSIGAMPFEPLLIAGLHVGSIANIENVEGNDQEQFVRLPQLRAKSKSRKSTRQAPASGPTSFELTGLRLNFPSVKAPQTPNDEDDLL